MKAEPFSLQINTEQPLIAREEKSHRVMELVMRAPQTRAKKKRAALNLALVLDRSGSMSGEKLEYVRQAAAYVIDLLEEGDRVSIVTYDDEVALVAESSAITSASRTQLKGRLASIISGRMTNLSEGWLRGCEQVALHMDEGGTVQVNRVLLLTDGLANRGITSHEALAYHACELAGRGISTSTFGVGEGFNEYLLEAIAQQGRGSFYFIAIPSDIPQIFKQEFEELSAITARDVEIELELPEQVGVEVLGGLHFEIAGQKLRISIGSLMSGREQAVYFSLSLPPSSTTKEIQLKATARAQAPDGQMLEAAGLLVFQYAAVNEVEAAARDRGLLERTAVVRVSYAASEALKLEREGRRAEAAQMLKKELHSQAENLPAQQAAYHNQLAEKMSSGMAEPDRKSAHYNSYLLRRQREDETFQKRQDEK